MTTFVSGAVEGMVDEAVFHRLVRSAKAEVANLYPTHGKSQLLSRLDGFNQAARRSPWLVLVDLDGDADCAPPFLSQYLPSPARNMVCRVVVRAVEAWLLADRERIARLLQVAERLVPERPEELPDPKRSLVELAGSSRSRNVREDFAPRLGSGRKVGPLYSSRIIGFVQDQRNGWRPRVAARSADSLDRCLRRLDELGSQTRRRAR